MGALATDAEVKMQNAQFVPETVKVNAGDTVKWANEDNFTHTINGFGINVTIKAGESFTHKFEEVGTFDYKCTIHADMKGKVVVNAKPAQPQTVNPIENNTTANNAETVTAPPPVAVTLSAEVTPENVVKVVSQDVTDVSSETATTLVNQAVTEIVKIVNKGAQEDIVKSIENVSQETEKEIASLKQEISSNPGSQEQMLSKIANLKELLAKIRAQVIAKHEAIAAKLKKEENLSKLYEIRWGDLTGTRQRCTGITINDLRSSLDKGEVPAKCDEGLKKVEYQGTISVDRGELKVHKQILFDAGDKVTDSSGTSISFSSTIAGHWDGLIVEYMPSKGDTSTAPVNTTIQIGDLDKTYAGSDALGQKPIGNDHLIEIQNLVQIVPGLALGLQQNLILDKLNLEDKVVELRNKLDHIRLLKDTGGSADEIESVINEAEKYNFDEAGAPIVQTEIVRANKKIGLDTSSDELKAYADALKTKIEELKSQAKDLKFAEKLIPFKDTDDDQWYTDYVSAVKNQGIISGYKDAVGNDLGEFRPGNNVTVAEILKIGLETSGKGKGKGEPVLQSALNHWAKDYVAKAEELGLDLAKGDTSLDRPATRGEVIRMMLEALGITPDPVSSTDFSDVQTAQDNDTGVAAYIQYAKKLGIVSGDSGATTFRPNDPINRAEVAKIANQIIDILLGGSVSTVTQ